MPLLIQNLRLPLHAEADALKKCIAQRCGVPEESVLSYSIKRRSLDARKKHDIHYLIHAVASLTPEAEKRALRRADASISDYRIPERRPIIHGKRPPHGRVIVAGLGPAGLFAAYLLAKEGYRPLILERGKPIAERIVDVEAHWTSGRPDPESNVLFGEGGAGTFSDGKLTSRSKDARSDDVLSLFFDCGAEESILYDAKPHIGTDRLQKIIPALRAKIEGFGGEVRFSSRLSNIQRDKNGLSAATIDGPGGTEVIACDTLVLSVGQGARDTIRMLYENGIEMEKKPFAAGVRIEHPQRLIDAAQFGPSAGDAALGAAEYRLTASHNGRGVFTFCMCPGGLVVSSASECDGIVVNGMSNAARDAINANSAIVVQVNAADLPGKPLSGIGFCEELERRAFLAGGGNGFAPAERVADFLGRRAPSRIVPGSATFRPGVTEADLWRILPDFIASGVEAGIRAFARQLPGFDMDDAVLTAVETRTSAPYRILRGEDMQSLSCPGLYPVGEGAGYAGGIVSSAIDGLRAAEQIIAR